MQYYIAFLLGLVWVGIPYSLVSLLLPINGHGSCDIVSTDFLVCNKKPETCASGFSNL